MSDPQANPLFTRLYEELFRTAQKEAPKEMCGLWFVGIEPGFHQTPNAAHNPEHEFLIAHHEYVRSCMLFDSKPWGIVHSHPRSGAAPSPKDCLLMDALQIAGQDLAMVIVGLIPMEIRCFKKQGEHYTLQWVWEPSHALPSL